jgi:hypothetical protein
MRQNYSLTLRNLSRTRTCSAPTTLENIFSDCNRENVVAKMKNAKPIARFEKDMKKGREAAILVPMCHIEGEPALLFMMRSRYLKNHRGEIRYIVNIDLLLNCTFTHHFTKKVDFLGRQYEDMIYFG